MITEIEIGWLAGLLEGEGYFGFNSNGKTPTFSVSMTDEDIIIRLADLCERITGKRSNIYTIDRFTKINAKWQQQYKIQLNGDPARMVMLLIVKQMGFRRRQKIWQILNGYKAVTNNLKAADLLQLVYNRKEA